MSPVRLMIKELRRARGLSVRELGRRANLSHASISRLETPGPKNPNLATLEKIAVAFGLGVDDLIRHRTS
jgi:transcriptional regulator with XRE-family HTH domain